MTQEVRREPSISTNDVWQLGLSVTESSRLTDLESVFIPIRNEAHRLKDEVKSSLGKARSESREYLGII